MTRRRGITLFEVLISLLILGISLAATSQLISRGVHAGLRQEIETEAALRCRSKIDELLSGTEPLRTARAVKFADDPQWQWTFEFGPTATPGLQLARVTVERIADAGSDATIPTLGGFSLSAAVRSSTIVSATGDRP